MKALLILLASTLIIALSIKTTIAYDFYVGGRDGWVQSPRESYGSWAERMRFQVNDKLVFKYNKDDDSVLLVKKGDFDSCNVNSPVQKLEGGDSTFQFASSGPFYFISGNQSRCAQGEKLVVVVMAVRNKKAPPLPPSPSPSTIKPPALAPSPSPSTIKPTPLPPSPSPSTIKPPALSPSPSVTPPASSPSPSTIKPPASSPSPSANPPASSPSTSPSLSPASVVPPASSPSSSEVSPESSPSEANEGSQPAAAPRPSSSSALSVSSLALGLLSLIVARALIG